MKHSYLQALREFIRNKWVLATLSMTAVFLLVNYSLVSGNAVGIWDVDDQYMPYQILLADHIRQGKLLMWDCWSNGGVSLYGDPQVGAFSPINMLLALTFGASPMSFIVLWLTVWWLGGFGVLLLGRHFNVTAWGSFIVAVQFLFVGLFITNAEHTSFVLGFSFIPLIIWRLDVAILAKSATAAVQSGALWGLSALSAYPGFTIATALFCFLWGLGRMFCLVFPVNNSGNLIYNYFLKPSITSLKTWILIVFSWLLAGTAVLSPTYFSFLYDGAGTTTRVGALSKETVLSINPLPIEAISSLTSPFLPVQKLYNPKFWADTDISMSSIYAGILPLLALMALLNIRSVRLKLWLLFLALFTLSLSLSMALPMREWLYDVVYPTRFFKHSSIFRAYFLFSITILALLGIKDLTNKLSLIEPFFKKSWLALIPLASSIIAVLLFRKNIQSLENVGSNIGLAYFQVILVWAGFCLLILLMTGRNKNATLFIPVLITLIALVDVSCTYIISKPVMMSDSDEMVKRWKKLDEQHSFKIDLTQNGFYRQEASCANNQSNCEHFNNDQMIKKVPVFGSYTTQSNKFHSEMLNMPILKNTALGAERIWFSPQGTFLNPDMKDFAIFAQRIKDSNSIPLIIHTPNAMLGKIEIEGESLNNETKMLVASHASAMIKINTQLNNYHSDELDFDVLAPSDGWVLVTDRWARTWNVEVNHMPSVVYGGNFIFRAVAVKKGLNKIRFYFQPTAVFYLIFLSWGTLILVILFSIKERLNKAI